MSTGRVRRMAGARALVLSATVVAAALPWHGPHAAHAQTTDSLAASRPRPFVPGGYDDKPYVEGLFGRIRLGGYIEGGAAWVRQDGVTDELGFELTRMNILTSTNLRGRVQVWAEIELEEGGQEVVLELAQVDLLLHRHANLRGGILLLPLGRFNLAHDGPRNELPRRPAIATELTGTALSQPGLGAFGWFGSPQGQRLTYEAYAVTGYDSGILAASADGTRLPTGRMNREDENASPAWVARTQWSAGRSLALGISGYGGAYNVYRVEGLDVDERRDLHVGVVDLDTYVAGVHLSGEGTLVQVDMSPGLTGVFASRQAGFYAQASHPFGRGWIPAIPEGWFTAAVRADVVDFDRDIRGDSIRSLTVGVNYRPIGETCFKLAFTRGEARDRFNNLATNAEWMFGLASYF